MHKHTRNRIHIDYDKLSLKNGSKEIILSISIVVRIICKNI